MSLSRKQQKLHAERSPECCSALLLISPGGIVVGVIFGSKRFGFNPDNMATPLAASFGDLLTLALLAGCSQFSYSIIGKSDQDNLSQEYINEM